jgi:hypothetical protein
VTYPEDRVLVGVVNRRRDLEYASSAHWYRIPQERMPHGVQTEYVALFLSRAFKERNGAVHYYAEVKGVELVYRHWLLPDEPNHPNAHKIYYRVALGDLLNKHPPIRNLSKRRLSFVYTTWDRFIQARTITDLYSKADHFVDRVYHALRREGVQVRRFWEAERRSVDHAPGLEIQTEQGSLYLSPQISDDLSRIDWNRSHEQVIQQIRRELTPQCDANDLSSPLDLY